MRSTTATLSLVTGGHIAMMVGLSENDAEPFLGAEGLRDCNDYTIGGVAAWYGPVSFRAEDVEFWAERGLNSFGPRIYGDESDVETQAAMSALVSPIVYYTADSPPLYVAHGDLDTTIPHGHVDGMREYAESQGITSYSYRTVTGAGHNFKQAGDDPVVPSSAEVVDETASKLLEFL